MKHRFSCAMVLLAAISSPAYAGSGIDHILNKDDLGLWSRKNQLALEYTSALVTVGGALWEGRESRLGRTFWRASDAMLVADAAAKAGKLVFQRQRPVDGNDPGAWFKGTQNKSFPSGEVTHITAIVTPFIAEYRADHPGVWLLAALPLYDGIARMKSQAHWQTDVLAGMALGSAVGMLAHQRDEAWLMNAVPHGLTVGYKKAF